MEYQSTRNSEVSVSAAYAIKTGLSADGGLFVPKSFPKFSVDFIGELSKMNYNERACAVFKEFLGDFSLIIEVLGYTLTRTFCWHDSKMTCLLILCHPVVAQYAAT